jgi:hypothetical protein
MPTQRSSAERAHEREANLPGPGRLLIGILAGPIAWAMQFGFSYTMTPYLCQGGLMPAAYLAALLALLLAGGGLLLAIGSWRRAGAAGATDAPGTTGRDQVMAVAGIGSSAFFMIVIAVQALPLFLIDPCR